MRTVGKAFETRLGNENHIGACGCWSQNNPLCLRNNLARLVGAGLRAEADGQAIPTVDSDNSHTQIHQFLIAEVLTHLVVNLVWNVAVSN